MTVYVIQEDKDKNILPARAFGELKLLLPPGNIVLTSKPAVKKIKKELKSFTDKDFLLLIGDPAAIAITSAIAALKNDGKFKLLKWDRQEKVYFEVSIDVGGYNE